MSCCHPNDRDEIRRTCIRKRLCQPMKHNFRQRQFESSLCRFNPDWFLEFDSWLEYIISKDVVFFLCCHLMIFEIGEYKGWDAFLTEGFLNWKE